MGKKKHTQRLPRNKKHGKSTYKNCNKRHSSSKRYNVHHLLFQGRYWSQGYYAKLLREHPYMKKKIPADGLHAYIHSKIHDVPVPNGPECKRAYQLLLDLENEGKLDVQNDTIEQRLQILIDVWAQDCPTTVSVLKWQRDLVKKFPIRKQKCHQAS